MVQKIGPKEMAQRALTERRAVEAEEAAKAVRKAERAVKPDTTVAAKPTLEALRHTTAEIPVKRRPKVKKK